MLKYNLQFFAKEGPGGEKTEPATSKKLSDARKKGQVAKSKEVNMCLALLTLFVCAKIWVDDLGTSFLQNFSSVYSRIPELVVMRDGMLPFVSIQSLIRNLVVRILVMLLPFMAVSFVVTFMGDLVQVKWKYTTEPMKFKLSKMNPLSGIKKLFSVQSLIELFRSLIKISLIVAIIFSTFKNKLGLILVLYDMPLTGAIGVIGQLVIDTGLKIALFYIVIAAADYLYTRWKFSEDMKMTKQEVKEEFKQAEGDPAVKSRQKAIMREASRRRMMSAVPQADVVITNPTHFAVAIKYDPDVSEAPLVTAKGEDYLAQKIKEVARENHVDIVENKPLARQLYFNVEIGEVIPQELYQAVAEILAMVYNTRGRV